MVPIGHYRDLDDEGSFVWFRAFPRMEARRAALEAFYTGPVWLAHRAEANATMIDSDNVLLLRSARPASGFDTNGLTRSAPLTSFVAASIFMLERPADVARITAFETSILPVIRRYARRIAYFVTEPRPNDFPRLPVREGEWAFVVTGVCSTAAQIDAWAETLGGETLRLAPAPRALFR